MMNSDFPRSTPPAPRRVVITGLGTINPLGHDAAATWDAIRAGRSGVGPITLFDAAGQTLAGETWRSKGGNCPFIGHCLPGQVRYTLVDGRISYQS